jgi:hypothetical protein
VEYTVAALLIDVALRITRQRSDQDDAVVTIPLRDPLKASLMKHREIGPNHKTSAQAANVLNKELEIRIQFRAASGYINGKAPVLAQKINYLQHDVPGHHLLSIRSSLYVAMSTALIAPVAKVDLKGLKSVQPQEPWINTVNHLFEIWNHLRLPLY